MKQVIHDTVLGNNTTLEVLDLSWNHIRRYGAEGVAAGLGVSVCVCMFVSGGGGGGGVGFA